MRIAIFTETYLPDANGVATHIKTLKDGLEALGHQVLIVKADASSHRNYIDNDVMHCPAVTSKKLYNYSLASPLSLKRLKMLKEWNPDIIHIQNEFGIGLSGIYIAKILKKPLVYTLHTMYDDYIYYIAHKPFVPMITKASHRYFRKIANNASAITGASKKIEEYLNKECGVKQPVNIIPNAVELDIFDESKLDRDKISALKEKYHITDDISASCFCGRLGQEKSVDVLLKYWKEQVKSVDKMRLFIFGDGPAREELLQLTKSLGIEDQVVFTGKIQHSELPAYYALCNNYITCSLSENYSISMLEAMASGLPVIHLYDEKNECQLIEGVNGFVFHDSEEMYSILKKLQSFSAEEQKKFSDNIKLSIQKSGSVDMAKYIIAIYSNLCTTHKK